MSIGQSSATAPTSPKGAKLSAPLGTRLFVCVLIVCLIAVRVLVV